MTTATTNGTAQVESILNAAILPSVSEQIIAGLSNAEIVASPADVLAGLIDELNTAIPHNPETLRTREYRNVAKNGQTTSWTVAYSTDHTTVESVDTLYAASVGKMVLSVKTDDSDRMLHELSLIRGGTRAYVPLLWKRDDAGFKTIDRKFVTMFRKAAERLAIIDRAAHHRFDYTRFTVMPAGDNAPADVAAYVRIVFTGTRVK